MKTNIELKIKELETAKSKCCISEDVIKYEQLIVEYYKLINK